MWLITSLVLFIGLAAGFGVLALKAASMSDDDFWGDE